MPAPASPRELRPFAHPCQRRAALLVLAGLLLAGCGSREDRDLQSGADVLYERGQKSMSNNNFGNAIRYFEALEARYPFSNQSKQAQLDLIYAYYKDGQKEAAIDAATQFERENPTHPRVDYALYMRGLALFSGQSSWYHRWFNQDLSKRPPRDVLESFSAFSQLLQRFPDSPYTPDARQRMIFLRNRLADHETHVARFYLDRGAYVAAINRAKYVMSTYDGAPAVPTALQVMAEGYERLGMNQLADETRRVLATSYPDISARLVRREGRPWYKFW